MWEADSGVCLDRPTSCGRTLVPPASTSLLHLCPCMLWLTPLCAFKLNLNVHYRVDGVEVAQETERYYRVGQNSFSYRLRDSTCWRSGEITQPRTNIFGPLCTGWQAAENKADFASRIKYQQSSIRSVVSFPFFGRRGAQTFHEKAGGPIMCGVCPEWMSTELD